MSSLLFSKFFFSYWLNTNRMISIYIAFPLTLMAVISLCMINNDVTNFPCPHLSASLILPMLCLLPALCASQCDCSYGLFSWRTFIRVNRIQTGRFPRWGISPLIQSGISKQKTTGNEVPQTGFKCVTPVFARSLFLNCNILKKLMTFLMLVRVCKPLLNIFWGEEGN
jgi:hypothetical protein